MEVPSMKLSRYLIQTPSDLPTAWPLVTSLPSLRVVIPNTEKCCKQSDDSPQRSGVVSSQCAN